MTTLIIQHVDNSDPPQFLVQRLPDGKLGTPVSVPSPVGFPVEGRPNTDLMRELRWYLEVFLDYPFHPETEHAERVQAALKAWGEQAFQALFDNRDAGRMFDAATNQEYHELQLRISSDDPAILYWPWEALRDPERGVLGRTCQVERRLNNKLRDPLPISDQLPRDRVNILLVTARPYEGDVRYRSISRPLVDQIQQQQLPATVTVLRPPTFDNLRDHLRQRPHHYHILHFDGHGGYGQVQAEHSPHAFQGPQGQLVFEDEHGKPDPKPASVLSELLGETAVPVVVLNACQSAMVDQQADDAFASVAAGLLRSVVRSVVAMAYSLYVSGAQEFLPAFYGRLFEDGNVADATRAGRQQMLAQPKRVSARGPYPLEDWLVPVLYQQDAFDVSFASRASAKETQQERQPGMNLPPEAQDTENPYGFIGRDGALLELERALRRPPAGILIHGLGGVGKTTLARGFLQWLAMTDGLGQGCFWFSFQDIRSAEFVFNQMVAALFGTDAMAAPLDQKIEALIAHFREHRFLIVWDNFEVVCGIPGSSLEPKLSAEDRQHLERFLRGLRGGQSRVLITSRSQEDWLDTASCYRLSIGGLEGEERWEYCETIVQDLGLTVNRTDPDWKELMDLLEGHPLAMRVVLPRLQQRTAGQLMEAIQSNLAEFASHDQESAKLFATLGFTRDGLPPELQPLLIPLALHERFVAAELLEAMAHQLDDAFETQLVDRLMAALGVAGLLRDRGQRIYEMHPALSRFLSLTVLDPTSDEPRDAWCREFVDVMGTVADRYAAKELHEQRPIFHTLSSNFRNALAQAERLGMDQDIGALTQSLAAYAQNERDFQGARQLFTRYAEHCESTGDQKAQAVAYHELGMIAQEQRDFAAAEQWYRKSLEIFEKQGNEHLAAISNYQLGMIAETQCDFAAAEQWYRKTLAISEKQGNEHGAARCYHVLGSIALKRGDFQAAEQWQRKSLAIFEKQRNEHLAASSYQALGMIAQEQREFAATEQWYRKSLAIKEKQGNEHGAAQTYHQLGIIAVLREQHEQAGQWFIKALAVFVRSDPHSAQISAQGVRVVYQQADESTRDKLQAAWQAAGLGDFPED